MPVQLLAQGTLGRVACRARLAAVDLAALIPNHDPLGGSDLTHLQSSTLRDTALYE